MLRLPVGEALGRATLAAETLVRWAEEHPAQEAGVRQWRRWVEPAATYAYQTRAAVALPEGVADARLAQLVEAVIGDEDQPWYTGFRGRTSEPVDGPLPQGVDRARVAHTRFFVGFGRERMYDQLIASLCRGPRVHVVTQRSVEGPPAAGTVPALTLAPSGDVFRWVDGLLVWDHVMTAPGAALLPGRLDRLAFNLMRRTGLDGAERRTYLAEAERFVAYVTDTSR